MGFFVWTVAWGRILNGDNLRRRGFPIVDWCYMCRGSGETVERNGIVIRECLFHPLLSIPFKK